jgi:hypothetical protein
MPTLFVSDSVKEELIDFLKFYTVHTVLESNAELRKLKPARERICRFCKGNNNSTAFKSLAHLIPKSTGNTVLFSDFECDKCNNKVGEWETSLSAFLGIYKSFVPIPSNSTPKNFKSKDTVIRQIKLSTGKIIKHISKRTIADSNISFDELTGTTTVTYYKQSYIPFDIVKLLWKISISCMSEQLACKYKVLINLLFGQPNELLPLFAKHIGYYEFEGTFKSPTVIMFEYGANDRKKPKYLMQFYFEDRMFMLHIPLHTDDFLNGKIEYDEILMCPPVFVHEEMSKVNYTRVNCDFSSKEKCQDISAFSVNIKPESLTKLSGWSKLKGFEAEASMANVNGLLFTQEREHLTEAELSELWDKMDIKN